MVFTASPLFFRYFDCSIRMNFRKIIFKMFDWKLSKQPSHYFVTDLKKGALKIYMYQIQEGMQLYIQKKILLQCSIYYFKCKHNTDPLALLLTFSCWMQNPDNAGNTTLMYVCHNPFDPEDLFYPYLAGWSPPRKILSFLFSPWNCVFSLY